MESATVTQTAGGWLYRGVQKNREIENSSLRYYFFTLANDGHFCFMKTAMEKRAGAFFLPALSTIPSGTLLDPVWLLNIFHRRKTGLFYTRSYRRVFRPQTSALTNHTVCSAPETYLLFAEFSSLTFELPLRLSLCAFPAYRTMFHQSFEQEKASPVKKKITPGFSPW